MDIWPFTLLAEMWDKLPFDANLLAIKFSISHTNIELLDVAFDIGSDVFGVSVSDELSDDFDIDWMSLALS